MSFVRKKSKPKQKLTPTQENRFVKIVIFLVLVALVWITFLPGSGLWALWKKRAELKTLQQQTVALDRENAQLQEDIDRLQNDPAYLEEIARKQHNLLRKNERVFEFKPKKSAKEE